MHAHKFKTGDSVKVIEQDNDMFYTVGKIYKISAVESDDCLKLNGTRQRIYYSKLQLVYPLKKHSIILASLITAAIAYRLGADKWVQKILKKVIQ